MSVETTRAADDVCTRLAALGAETARPPRLLLVLAHPDDETIAVGGRMEWMDESRLVGVTDGAPRDGADTRAHGYESAAAYADARQRELAAALHHAGLPPTVAHALHVDGRHTPDKEARDVLLPLTHAVLREIEAFQPEAVLTHPYEGGHPDHDACAFAVHAAVRMLGGAVPVVEAPFYHRGPHGFTTACFLAGDVGCEAVLTAAQAANKQARLDCFRSQAQTLALFGVASERYRAAPAYDFRQPPHAGRVYYEDFGWGMTGDSFCALAAAALETLGL